MIHYQIFSQPFQDQELGSYIGFGVCACRSGEDGEEILVRIPNVFLSADKAQHFVQLCNELGLALLHLPDAIEDQL